MAKRQYMKKICLLGDGEVGKTSLIRRYVLDIFDDQYIQTFGAKVMKKVLDLENVTLTIMIWDVLGQKSHDSSVASSFFEGANGALLVCDMTRPETLDHLRQWEADLLKVRGKVPIIILGNKSDLEMKIDPLDLQAFADALGYPAMLTSAKTGQNVSEAFQALSEKLMEG
ncbi:MAG TPA: Rab family GTPase [Methanomassiliicoccales archaeon]|nr:Rab family GTPase [Methanomassiliicoccales archaeon]HQQ25164.1 Rab family GTPase [Methanomassiliicoccales archaeon]